MTSLTPWKMSPLAKFATLTAAGALLLTACGEADAGGDASGDDAGPDELTVGSDLTYPPYTYFEDDEPAGFDPEIVDLLAEELGADHEIQDTRFEQLIPNLDSGHIDVIASALYITADRAEEVDYVPYFSTGNSIVVTADADPLEDAMDLCGLEVSVIRGGDIVDRLRDDASADCEDAGESAVEVREFGTDPEATQALASGQVDAQVTDAGVASTLAESEGVDIEITSTDLLYPVPVGLGVAKGNDELREQLETALQGLEESGSYQELLEEYNLEPIDEDQVAEILGE